MRFDNSTDETNMETNMETAAGSSVDTAAYGACNGRCRNPECFTDVGKQIQVAVDGSEADIRKFLLYVQIDGICGGVVIPGQQKTLDRLPLAAVF